KDDGTRQQELRRRDTHGLHDLRHVAEVGNLVAHRSQKEDRAEQQATQDGERTPKHLRHGNSPYARSNNRTSDGTAARTEMALSSVTATPSPTERSWPRRFTLPRSTWSHAP